MRNSRSAALAMPLSTQITGWKTFDTHTSGGARISTVRSGTEKAMFFATISPNTTCRYVTISSVITKLTVPTAASGIPVSPSGTSSRWWIDGSETFRISSEQIVMPSCEVASISVACSMAYSAVFAARLPFSARGSICERRAEITANSAPTKKAFPISRTNSQTIPAQSLTTDHLHRPAPGRAGE